MNRLGGRSNTGEGGEDPARFADDRRSSIKQVASGRFGVTVNYLANADELQIKVARGAKPGEGGQLPGHKVDRYIARLRHSTPGPGLISPPPHHDIYSIEDLKQLIYDLRCANPRARVGEARVRGRRGHRGRGSCEANADHVVIAGHDGGTGASPQASIQHAGIPWEIGLAETQQTLLRNDLRSRILVEVDGQMRTGRDVVWQPLGADEYGFSTAPLIALGCVMMRVCHLNTCPVGIATPGPGAARALRGGARARRELPVHGRRGGAPDHVPARRALDGGADRTHGPARPGPGGGPPEDPGHRPARAAVRAGEPSARRAAPLRAPPRPGALRLDRRGPAPALPAVEEGRPIRLERRIENKNRAVGGLLSGEIARVHGENGLPEGSIHVKLTGSAGQSFGAWLARGVELVLEGDANDYCGKGLSGGTVVVRPPADATFPPSTT